jgi:hypothetical protein
MTMDEKQRPADWQLERLAQGELDEKATRALTARLGVDEVAARLAAVTASDQEILARLPPEVVGASIRRRLASPRRRGPLLMALVPLAVAASVWAIGYSPRLATGPGADQTRIKGAPHLLVYRAGSAGKPARLSPAARVRPHDQLQLAYTGGDARYGTIVSVDGRGVVTRHLPVDAAGPAALAAGETRLPQSYELDDAPGFERFFFITGPRPFSLDQVLAAAGALARDADARHKPLALDPALSQESLLLEKVQP